MTASGSYLFPVIRPLSRPVARLLVRSPLSANQVTALSLVAGMACNVLLLRGTWEAGIWAGVLFVLCYVFDNADGDVARAKNQCSEFGKRFDSFVDWLVHSLFFAALGYGHAAVTGQEIWIWLGWVAFAGGTINYVVGFLVEARERRRLGEAAKTGHESPEESRRPEKWYEWAVFAFRELSRADFCFLVLALALFDVLWVLLPAGAVGAQVYWATQFVKGANDYHV